MQRCACINLATCHIRHLVTVWEVAVTVPAHAHRFRVHGKSSLGVIHVQTCDLFGDIVGTVEQGSHQRHWSGGNPRAVTDLCGRAVLV